MQNSVSQTITITVKAQCETVTNDNIERNFLCVGIIECDCSVHGEITMGDSNRRHPLFRKRKLDHLVRL